MLATSTFAALGTSAQPTEPRDPTVGRAMSALGWNRDFALATSSTTIRRWRAAGAERHHIVEPRTGLPARLVRLDGSTATTAGRPAEAA